MTYQVKMNKYRNIYQTIYTTFKHEGGVLSLYRGFVPTILGIVPYAGVSFFTYDTLKNTWLQHKANKLLHNTNHTQHNNNNHNNIKPELGVIERFICGATAGLTAQTASYPLDTVRRRMQLNGLSSTIPKYTSMYNAIVSIIRTDGIRGLYVGLSINYIKAGPTHAVSFLTYEYCKQRLGINDINRVVK